MWIQPVHHRQIPPNLHFNTPNPKIDFKQLKLRVPKTLTEFPKTKPLAIAGVNAFGFGGSNTHIVLSEPPPQSDKKMIMLQKHDSSFILPITARSKEALHTFIQSYDDYLANSNTERNSLADIVYSATFHRTHFNYRTTFIANTKTEFRNALQSCLKNEGKNYYQCKPNQKQTITFVYSGQGPQWWAMGRELLKKEPVFRNIVTRIDAVIQKLGTRSLLAELTQNEAQSRLHETAIAQPAIFAVQAGLTALLKSWGIQPNLILGHSVGEVSAAYAATAFSLEEATRIIFHRGRCMENAASKGRMLAVNLNVDEIKAIINQYNWSYFNCSRQ